MVHEGTESLAVATEQGVASESRTWLAADMAEAEFVDFAGRKLGIVSQRSPGKTTDNEDAVAVIPWGERSGVLIIADGMGGGAMGEVASRLTVRNLIEAIEATDREQTQLRTAILNGIEAANREVRELGRGAATTLAVVEVAGTTIRHYHVGDSAILACGQRGKIKVQTVAHSPVGYGVEAGLLDIRDALHHEDRHVVSNVLGMPDMRVEVGSEIRLAPRDTLLMASDGLFDNLHVSEIVERIRKGPLKTVCAQLQSLATRRMTQPTETQPSKADDLTFLVWR
jgi:PPM family protein phosphatase